MMQVRPYQQEAIDGIYNALDQADSTLIVMATGTGKTITFSVVADEYMKRGRVMILAHRAELIYQAQDKLMAVTGVEADIEMGENHVAEFGAWQSKAVVSTIQTQKAGMAGLGRMSKFNPDEFSLLIIDECHHSAAKSYREVIEYYQRNPNLKVLGVTATPDRADELALGQIFKSVAYEYGIMEGITDGYLVPISQRAVFVDGLDYSTIRTTMGDLNGGDLSRVMEQEESLHGIASPTLELIGDKKTLVFCASLDQSSRLTEIFNRHTADIARSISGGMEKDERRSLFKDYAAKRFQILVNVGVATEGFDDPGIEVVVMARPTKSRSLYAQMAGRGTRVLPGVIDVINDSVARRAAILSSAKPTLEIIDFVGNSGRHKLMTTADILGGHYSEEVIERATRNSEEASKKESVPVDIITELKKAEIQIAKEAREREEADKRDGLVAKAKFSTATVNPFDIMDVMPERTPNWHKGRIPTENQVAMLEKNGVDVGGLDFTHASQLIDRIISRRKEDKASYKMTKLLSKGNNRQKLTRDPAEYSFSEARQLIDALANNRWRPPDNWDSVIKEKAESAQF